MRPRSAEGCKEEVIRRTPIRKRRAKPRRGPLRAAQYRKWLTFHRCVVAIYLTTPATCWPMLGLSDPAHTQNNGMRSKGPDSSCVPLCRGHHREYDAGRKAFEKKYGIDMKAESQRYWNMYENDVEQIP